MEDARARELMQRCGAGDIEAFAELVEAHRDPVLRVVYRYLGSRAPDAEDIAQEAFIRAFRARERYRPEAKFTTWLYRIVTNLCLNYLRDTRGKRALSLSAPIGGDDGSRIDVADPASEAPGTAVAREETQEAVRAAIARLPESQRLAIIYARYEELSHAEIAEAMELTEKGVKSLLFRARENLRRLLQPQLRRLGHEEPADDRAPTGRRPG